MQNANLAKEFLDSSCFFSTMIAGEQVFLSMTTSVIAKIGRNDTFQPKVPA